jgi:hypothetical protein
MRTHLHKYLYKHAMILTTHRHNYFSKYTIGLTTHLPKLQALRHLHFPH